VYFLLRRLPPSQTPLELTMGKSKHSLSLVFVYCFETNARQNPMPLCRFLFLQAFLPLPEMKAQHYASSELHNLRYSTLALILLVIAFL
jgi:hypothetical protein